VSRSAGPSPREPGDKPVAEPRPAASVLLVREAPPDAPEPIEVYMIRRQKTMKFLGGFYAFPGGRVDDQDAAPAVLGRCYGLDEAAAEAIFPTSAERPALAYWVTAVRELLEETGVLCACDAAGRPVDAAAPDFANVVERARKALIGKDTTFAEFLAMQNWSADLSAMRYLSHFITPKTSPIRFSARFFLCPVPPGQAPRLFTEETSEGFWIHPGEGHRRFRAGEMAMAEPAEYGLAYLAQFDSLAEIWAAHEDAAEKMRGLVDRIEFWAEFDWKEVTWRTPRPR
jgi:8-oxo-dGTP pyrophosphatase MutT (NUDIX family)